MVTAPVVVIPTIRARPDLLAACLAACEQTLPDDVTVQVIEGGTFAENCNQAPDAPVVIFLNDDTVPLDDWYWRLVAPFADPDVGIVGARLLYPDGRVQHAGIYLTGSPQITAHNRTWDVPSGPVVAVTGACMAVRRECWDQLGGFDPTYRNGYEDVDVCLRAAQAGWTVWYQADADVIHHESASGSLRWQWVRDNVELFVERWQWLTHPTS